MVAWRWALVGLGAALALPASAGPRGGLDGTWTNGWYTQLERPKEFRSLVVTPEEAEAYEAPRRQLNGMLPGKPDEVGQAESEFNEGGPGLARIRGEIRSSWITDPADGKTPWRPEVKERYGVGKPVEKFDHVEERPTDERCLTARGANAPILNSPDTNYIQIVEAPDHVAIVSEKNHDVRIVHLRAGAAGFAPPEGVWGGISTGRWEGKTLVVTTTQVRFTKVRGLILAPTTRVVERFTRTGRRELSYEFEVEDPNLFTQPWRGEMVFRAADAPMYEFACHEGNYSLASVLAAARQAEAAAAAAAEDRTLVGASRPGNGDAPALARAADAQAGRNRPQSLLPSGSRK